MVPSIKTIVNIVINMFCVSLMSACIYVSFYFIIFICSVTGLIALIIVPVIIYSITNNTLFV